MNDDELSKTKAKFINPIQSSCAKKEYLLLPTYVMWNPSRQREPTKPNE